jgi:hypothetical protein
VRQEEQDSSLEKAHWPTVGKALPPMAVDRVGRQHEDGPMIFFSFPRWEPARERKERQKDKTRGGVCRDAWH